MGRPSFTNKFAALSPAGVKAYEADCDKENKTRTDFNHPISSQWLLDGKYDKL